MMSDSFMKLSYQYTELLLLDTNFIYLCILHLTLKTIKLQIRLPFIWDKSINKTNVLCPYKQNAGSLVIDPLTPYNV